MKQQTRPRTKSPLLRVTPDTDGADFTTTNPLFPRRPLQAPTYLLPKEYYPLDDTLTEAAGLARGNEATDAYAGSY